MLNLCNLHTHTIFCDGENTPEEMVKAAIDADCAAIGFSGHSYVGFDSESCMSREAMPDYMREIMRLKEHYAGMIDVFCGIEQDYFSEPAPKGLHYIIGSVHYIQKDGDFVCIDNGASRQRLVAELYFGGDFYALAEAFFETVSDIAVKTGADIIGHFDLIAKYNRNGSVFDETNPRYTKAALDAMERVLETCNLFEVNTGAMYRFGRTEPYPSVFLLKELCKRGGEVILSSDSHDTTSLCHKFSETAELLKACGFKYIKRLTENGFIDDLL